MFAGSAPALALPHPQHITIVMLENKDARELLDRASAPYFAGVLTPRGALFDDARAVAHPSLPNYLALFSGSTHEVRDDHCGHIFTGPNLASEAIAAGLSWAGYAENMPAAALTGTCFSSDHLWAKKHTPWLYFTSARTVGSLPYAGFPGSLPALAWIVPNMCHDMHDCPVASGDAWMQRELPAIVRYDAGHNGLLIVTFDESDSKVDDNRIATLFVGPMIKPGSRSAQHLDHYGVLRTIEDLLRLPHLGASAHARAAAGIWR